MRKHAILFFIFTAVSGCCPPEEDLTNGFHQTLIDNPVMRFVDENGNEMLLVYSGRERHDVSGQGTGENRTMHCEASAFMQRAEFVSSPDINFGFVEHTSGLLRFEGGQLERVGDSPTDTVEVRPYLHKMYRSLR